MLLDIFCRVIDNFGDIGVCWRLSADLAARGHGLRLWVDDSSALRWMAPGALEGQWPGIAVFAWDSSCDPKVLAKLPCADAWIEAFGCDVPEQFVAHFAEISQGAAIDISQAEARQAPVWINLEYLSAEPYVERSHGLPSPIMAGPARGWTKYFFYPGFSAQTGGLLREPGLNEVMDQRDAMGRSSLFQSLGVREDAGCVISLFCYEPPLLKTLLDECAASDQPVSLLVTHGRATRAVQLILGTQTQIENLRITYLPLLTQPAYDNLLACCDVNFVRGEDSLLRAIWAGKPFVWHLYPQHDLAHSAKLGAFLERMQFNGAIRTLHHAWNGLPHAPQDAQAWVCLQAEARQEWLGEVQAARQRLLEMDDLTTRLLEFMQKKR